MTPADRRARERAETQHQILDAARRLFVAEGYEAVTMRRIADDPAAVRTFDRDGREVIDDETWRAARSEAERIGIDAGMLAVQMRTNRNADERAIAFYAAFWCSNIDYVFNLISHIPGEPLRQTRERAYPRAIAFLQANIGRKFGELSEDQQNAIRAEMPQIGSPAAKSRGITREPRADDLLHSVHLVPFLQLLDLDEALDQAQGLWFLKEACLVRRDLAKAAKEGTQAPAWQLFDVARDPKETTDVASAQPDVVTRLAAIADREYAESQRFPLARTR
jgi:hypothetical protein